MNTPLLKLAIISLSFLVLSFSGFGKDKTHQHNSSPAVFTVFKMTPKQFSKSYQAERQEYKSHKEQSFRKMNRRLKGPWFKRWFNKTF